MNPDLVPILAVGVAVLVAIDVGCLLWMRAKEASWSRQVIRVIHVADHRPYER
jgi:hypothetical protein